MNEPLVSVVMPVYNGEKYLAEAISSILGQTFSQFEFIIINDGSTDASEQIILSFKDERIRYVRNEMNLKIIDTLNKGFALAKGKYIARMDADDVAHPERLAKQFAAMEEDPSLGLCGTDITINNMSKNDVPAWIRVGDKAFSKFALLFYNPICHPTTMLRTAVLRKHDLTFRKEYVHAEDYDLWVQIAKHSDIINLPEKLLSYRVHDEQVSSKHSDLQAQTVERIKTDIYEQMLVFPSLKFKQAHLYLVNMGFSGQYPVFKDILFTFRKSGFFTERGKRAGVRWWLRSMNRVLRSNKDWKNKYLAEWLTEIKKAAAEPY